MAKNFLTADQALKVEFRRYGEIDVPELGGTLRLASLGASAALELMELQEAAKSGKNQRQLMLFLIKNTCVDPEGNPLFDDAQASKLLERVSVATTTLLIEKMTGFIAEGLEKRKNSEASPSAS
jgi:hypothetical protein